MQLILILALLGLIAFFLQAGNSLAAIIVFLLLLVDILGGYVSAFLTFLWALWKGLLETGSAEFDELEKTKTHSPAGKKFLEESLLRTGKALGKGEAAKSQGKRITDKRPAPEAVHTGISDFMAGLGKLFRK